MTLPAYPQPPLLRPPAPPRRKRRWWLIGVVAAWAVVVVVIAVWSVRNDPPSVPDERNIKQALPSLESATAAMLTAADVPGQVVVLGALTFTDNCRITPVRSGAEASRTVTVHVRADQAPAAFAKIAQGLPPSFKAQVAHSAQQTRLDFYADAGGYVAIESTAQSDDTVFSLRADTGCRPKSAGVDPHPADAPATTRPAAFDRALRLLDAAPTAAGGPVQRSLACANGKSARSVTSGAVPESAGFAEALESSEPAAAIVQVDPHAWAYRDGEVSIVVGGSDGSVRVIATTGCR